MFDTTISAAFWLACPPLSLLRLVRCTHARAVALPPSRARWPSSSYNLTQHATPPIPVSLSHLSHLSAQYPYACLSAPRALLLHLFSAWCTFIAVSDPGALRWSVSLSPSVPRLFRLLLERAGTCQLPFYHTVFVCLTLPLSNCVLRLTSTSLSAPDLATFRPYASSSIRYSIHTPSASILCCRALAHMPASRLPPACRPLSLIFGCAGHQTCSASNSAPLGSFSSPLPFVSIPRRAHVSQRTFFFSSLLLPV